MIKLLFLAANPSDTSRLRLDAEIQAIQRALSEARFHDRFELTQYGAVRAADLQGHLLKHEPHIVHFSGHGSGASEIILEDQNGKSKTVPQHALEKLFSVLKGNVRCVVLNACYSEIQAKAIAAHVPCVVGMATAIHDTSAVAFSMAFYQALGYGQTLQTAYQLGCLQIGLDRLQGEETPQLIALREDPSRITLVAEGALAKPEPGRRDRSFERTGIEIYCKKPWSKLGMSPHGTILLKSSGFSLKRRLMWEAFVFVPLEPDQDYDLIIKRPSDFVSLTARVDFRLRRGEVKRYVYESPPISFMAGEIRPFSPREMTAG